MLDLVLMAVSGSYCYVADKGCLQNIRQAAQALATTNFKLKLFYQPQTVFNKFEKQFFFYRVDADR